MQPRLWTIILTAVLFAGSAALAADAPNQDAEKPDAKAHDKEHQKLTAPMVLKKLHKGNTKEIRAGELAMAHAGSEPARVLGETLVHDHSEAESVIKDLAKEHNVEFTEPIEKQDGSSPDADKDKKPDDLAALKLKTGEEFDRAFAKQMVKDHDKTIAMLENVKKDDSLQKLHGLADQLLPVLKKHKQMAQDITAHSDGTNKDQGAKQDGNGNRESGQSSEGADSNSDSGNGQTGSV